MALFVGMILFNLARGLDISCGCFSTDPDDDPITVLTLARDILFLVLSSGLAVLVFVNNTRRMEKTMNNLPE
jgi:hypothetical protein